MPLFIKAIKESFIYKFIFICLIMPYKQSNLKININKMSIFFKNSIIYKTIDTYLSRDPYFLNSNSYKFFEKFMSKFNILANKLNKFCLKCVNNSQVAILVKSNRYSLFENKKLLYNLGAILIVMCILDIKLTVILLSLILIVTIILLDYQRITYILALYPLIDYVLRLIIPGVAGIWDELLLIGMFGIWLYKIVFYRNKNSFKHSPLDLSVTSFIIAMICVFIANSPDYGIALEGLRATIQYVIWFYVVFQIVDDEKSAKNVCLVFVLLVSLMAIHGVYQYIIGVEMPASWVDSNEDGVRTRVYSILTSPNILGSLMILALPLCLSFATISETSKQKTLFYFLSLMMTLTLIFTFSRGAWIGFAVAIVMYVFLKDKRLLIPAIILGGIALVLVPGIWSRISYMLSPEYIESSLRGGRLVRWITGLDLLFANPLFGVGHGHFGGAVAMNNGAKYTLDLIVHRTYYMDNYYLKTAVETGFFGLFFFMNMMYQIVINGIKTIKITKNKKQRELEIGILAGLFGVIIHNFVENVFEVPMMTSCFWLLVAVLMAFWNMNYYQAKK